MSQLTVDELKTATRLRRKIYQDHAAGCCWHIVLDDGNLEDSSVVFCIQQAKQRGCTFCMDLGPLVKRMSRTQRAKLSTGGYNKLLDAPSS